MLVGITTLSPGLQSCPPEYYSVKIANSVFICISDDYESGEKNFIPFAGFYRTQAGNSLASTKTDRKACPEGYSSHLAYIDDTNEIRYFRPTAQLRTSLLLSQVLPFVLIYGHLCIVCRF